MPNVEGMTHIPAVRQAFIVHGYGATPDDHWFPWLATKLEALDISTQVPMLPDPEAPDPGRWAAALGQAVGVPDDNTVVVAHSLGCITVLRYLLTLSGPWRLGSLVLVSGFVDKLPALPLLDSYIGEGLDPARLSKSIGHVAVIRSDGDPYVPVGYTDALAQMLGTGAVVVPGAGHFLAADGVTSLPQALEGIPETGNRPKAGTAGG